MPDAVGQVSASLPSEVAASLGTRSDPVAQGELGLAGGERGGQSAARGLGAVEVDQDEAAGVLGLGRAHQAPERGVARGRGRPRRVAATAPRVRTTSREAARRSSASQAWSSASASGWRRGLPAPGPSSAGRPGDDDDLGQRLAWASARRARRGRRSRLDRGRRGRLERRRQASVVVRRRAAPSAPARREWERLGQRGPVEAEERVVARSRRRGAARQRRAACEGVDGGDRLAGGVGERERDRALAVLAREADPQGGGAGRRAARPRSRRRAATTVARAVRGRSSASACRAASSRAGWRPKRAASSAAASGRATSAKRSSPRCQAARRPWKAGP